MRLFAVLLSGLLAACGGAPPGAPDPGDGKAPTAARAEAQDEPFGEEVVLEVAGEGIVTTDPEGHVCGGPATRTCELAFPHDRVVLRAAPSPDWRFQHWVFVVDDRSPEFDPPPLGLDLAAEAIVLAGGTRARPDGGQRRVRHRVTAVFARTGG